MSAAQATPDASGTSAGGSRPRKRLSKSGKVRAVLALGTVVGLGTVATLAAWSDTGSATGSFSTGTLVLQLNGVHGGPTAITALSMSNATPGTTIYALLPVNNAGSIPFTYGWTTTSTNGTDATPLNANLNWSAVTLGTNASCTSTTYAAAAAIPASYLSPTTTLSAAPAVSGRTLAAGATENLCFQVTLPAAAPAGVQGRTTVATLAFTANQ